MTQNIALNTKKISESENIIENNIPGLHVPVKTWIKPLEWKIIQVPITNRSFSFDKRDQYHKRSELCDILQGLGEFQYAMAYCTKELNVEGCEDNKVIQSGKNKGKAKASYPIKCSLCGSGHSWAVFYRRADESGTYLGHSGIPCFAEVLRNIGHERADEIAATVVAEQRRADKFRSTMERITYFKRDFPGLYENRYDLSDRNKNPYFRIWNSVIARLASGKPVDEQWLQECHDGKLSSCDPWSYVNGRLTKIPVHNRIPAFLRWGSQAITNDHQTIDQVLKKCQDKYRQENSGSSQPPTPNRSHNRSGLEEKARWLNDHGKGWSDVVQKLIRGEPASQGMIDWIDATYAKMQQV